MVSLPHCPSPRTVSVASSCAGRINVVTGVILLAEGEESLNVDMGLELLVEILTFVRREGRPEGSGVACRGRKILRAKFCCT